MDGSKRFVAATVPETQGREAPAGRPDGDAVAAGRPEDVVPEGQGCLLLTRDEALADHVALVAAAAGVVLTVNREPHPPAEADHAVVLVGHDLAEDAWDGLGGSVRWSGKPVILAGYPDHEETLWRAAARRPGARVAVLPRASAWLGEFLGQLGLRGGPGHVLLVAGAAGGVGTTTAGLLSAAAAGLAGSRSLFIDADPHSRGVWPSLRTSPPDAVGWEDLARSRGRMAPAHLAEILPLAQGTAVLTWSGRSMDEDLPLDVLTEVVPAARRIYDTVVVEAGRSAGLDGGLAALADSGLLVLPARAVPGIEAPSAHSGELRWSAVVCGRLAAGTDPSSLAAAAGMPLARYLPSLRAISGAAAEGRLVSVLARRRVLELFRSLATVTVPAGGRVAA